METPVRLFDLPEYQLKHHPSSNMLSAKREDQWVHYSTKWFIDTVKQVSASFCQEGIGYKEWTAEKRDKIAVISENRPEWMIVDHATQMCGAILVPLYPTINQEELLQILKEAEIKWLFISNLIIYKKVKDLLPQVPSLKKIYSFDSLAEVSHWKELLKKQPEKSSFEKVAHIKSSIQPEDLVTIIYTSGTSGDPKGVMLSHRNILSNVLAGYECLPIKENGRALSFLPLNHVYERMITYLYIYAGVPIYFAESIGKVGENLKEVKPYIFATVPRLLESVYEKILEKGNQLTGIKKRLFFWAIKIGKQYELHAPQSTKYKIQLAVANRLIYSQWRKALGGEVEVIVTGSAACQDRLLRLFSAANIVILEGYGLTETSPVVSVNRMEKVNRKFGTIGLLINNVEARIASDGEILCKGPNIMMGYYKRPKLTADVITEGWFKTGDIGEWIEGRFLKITDRKKELFKLSGGKYIAPLPIETKMEESQLIRQIMVVGSNEKFVAALIVPHFEKIFSLLDDNDQEMDKLKQDLSKETPIFQLLQKEIKHYNQYFSPLEQIKKIQLLPQEWTIEEGELTPTLKLKRRVISKKYKDIISSIYR